ncbi:hypothetical protein L1887_37302 [Cichorium endivia]|nr:hypothetical protein L1887_37302 [Cichorium endivia]
METSATLHFPFLSLSILVRIGNLMKRRDCEAETDRSKSIIEEEYMEDMEYGWGVGSVVAMLFVVGCMLFLPLVMGPVAPPSIPVLLLIPVMLAAILIFLIHASKPHDH